MKTSNTLIALTAALVMHTTAAFAQSGAVDSTFMRRVGPNTNVNAVVVQPDGKVLFGGAFTNVNFTPRNRLARAEANGELDAGFDPGNGPDGVVHALALQSDGKVLVGGAFTLYNGTPRSRLARLNADGTLDATFDPGTGADGVVKFVAVQTNGQVFIQGSFANFNGVPRLGLARLNDNGSLDSSFDPGSRAATVSAVAWQPGGKVVFSGAFTSLDGLGATNLARLNADGSLDTNFTALASLNARADSAVIQRDGKILLSGLFTNANGTPSNRIARLNPDGSLDASFNPGSGFNVSGLPVGRVIRSAEQPDAQLLVWGSFSTFNRTNRNGAVRLNPNGSFDPSFNPASGLFSGTVTSVCFQTNGQMLATSRSVPYLRRFLADGSLDSTWMSETGANSDVQTIVLQPDGKSLLGGWFTQMNGVPHVGLARLNSDGSLDASFNPNFGFDAGVYFVGLQSDDKMMVGGWFTNVNGVARTNLARLNGDGSLDASFNASYVPDDGVYAMVLQPDGKLLVSGVYATGETAFFRLNADGGLDASFNVMLRDDAPGAIALQPDGKMVISASVTNIDGLSRTNCARLNSDGTLDASFDSGLGPNDWVSAVALQPDGKLLVGGYFTTWNGAE